jgi:hypothetical protein
MKEKRLSAPFGWLTQDKQGDEMRFTAIFMDIAGNYLTKFFVTCHDKNQAWKEILSQTPEGHSLVLIIPGEQLVYSQDDISLTNVA